KQKLAETRPFDAFQELLRDYLVRIYVDPVHRRHDAGVTAQRLHGHSSLSKRCGSGGRRAPRRRRALCRSYVQLCRSYVQWITVESPPGAAGEDHTASQPTDSSGISHSRTSTKCPAMAAAAAISGLTRCVRPPRPWRPSKLRLDVDAHRSPGAKMSGFMPRHMLQPASRHSKPAALKILSSPSASACFLTNCEPGTTMARTWSATRRPFTTRAAARKSCRRALV